MISKIILVFILSVASLNACCACGVVSSQMSALKSFFKKEMATLDSDLKSAWEDDVVKIEEDITKEKKNRDSILKNSVSVESKKAGNYNNISNAQANLNGVIMINKTIELNKQRIK